MIDWLRITYVTKSIQIYKLTLHVHIVEADDHRRRCYTNISRPWCTPGWWLMDNKVWILFVFRGRYIFYFFWIIGLYALQMNICSNKSWGERESNRKLETTWDKPLPLEWSHRAQREIHWIDFIDANMTRTSWGHIIRRDILVSIVVCLKGILLVFWLIKAKRGYHTKKHEQEDVIYDICLICFWYILISKDHVLHIALQNNIEINAKLVFLP